jgi:hypothetical protein
MHDGSILDLGLLPEFAQQPKHFSVFGAVRFRILLTLIAVVALAAGLGSIGIGRALQAIGLYEPAGEAMVRIPLDELRQVQAMTVDDKSQIVVEGLDAQLRNAALPLSGSPVEHVDRFRIWDVGASAPATALRCLTQAVYYESAYEPLAGRRAVAQVVLNRMRHPAYPKSVCGVVYQGSERRTGCQFSFTCDGSLLRRPAIDAWREAEDVARAALSGYVEPSVGTATHYHADYVLPKWAFQLGKITQIGRHIFYRFNGSWGRSAAFSGRYSGVERIPALNLGALQERLATGEPAGEAPVSGLTVPPHVTDRHSETDVGGRLDMTKEWRLDIPDPTVASSRYREVLETESPKAEPKSKVAAADPLNAKASQ